MNAQIEKFKQRRAERMAEKNKDGGPGSGKKPGYGSAKAKAKQESSSPAIHRSNSPTKEDLINELGKHGVKGKLDKKPMPTHSGMRNQILDYGTFYCDNPKDTKKALDVFTKCGYNLCEIFRNSINILHDTSKEDN